MDVNCLKESIANLMEKGILKGEQQVYIRTGEAKEDRQTGEWISVQFDDDGRAVALVLTDGQG